MVHHNHHQHHERDPQVAVATAVVYVTASPTFSGPVWGYSTPADSLPQTQAAGASNPGQPAAVPTVISAPAASDVVTSSLVAEASNAGSMPTRQQVPTNAAVASSAAASSAAIASISNVNNGASASAPTASPSSQASTSTGLSGGAQAGIAIGVLLAVCLALTAAFVLYRRKKGQEDQQKLDDEKSGYNGFGNNNSNNGPGIVPRVSVRRPRQGQAPRLSLRPLTDLFPQEMNEKAASTGLAAPAPVQVAPQSEKSNPFGDHARAPAPVKDSVVPAPLNLSRPASPAPSNGSGSGAAQGPRSGPPNGPNGPLNVHRVQLDFAPSMDDELELKQGQLVRMLHEYDDGWALCIRLDRSQQGVVPRSCISKLPVKPRPNPNGQAPRPGPNGRPPVNGQRPQGGPPSRSQSPAPQGPFGEGQYRARAGTNGSAQPAYAASNLSASPANSPEGSPTLTSAPLARKPVPGQAV